MVVWSVVGLAQTDQGSVRSRRADRLTAHIARGAFAAGIHLGDSDQVGGSLRWEATTLDAFAGFTFLKKNCRDGSDEPPPGKCSFGL
jgi:hypothetical protein